MMPRNPPVPFARRRRGARALPAWLAGLTLSCLLAVSPADATLPPPVSWSAAQQRASGLRIEQLRPGAYRRTQDALAEVLDSGALLRVQAQLDAARAGRSQAQADLRLARLRARQASALFRAGQDVARAELDRARVVRDKAQAALLAADSAVRAARAACSMRLGAALSRQLHAGSRVDESLASGRELVLRLQLAPGSRLPADARVRVFGPGSAAPQDAHRGGLDLRVLGPAPHAAAGSQGLAYLGLIPARDGLMPGLRVAAVAESGRALRGLWVPASAVLFHGGRAFVFAASKPAPGGDRQFTARIVSTAWPLGDGYVQPGWPALDVVVGGAGLLLTPPPEAHTLPPAGATDERDAG